MELTLSVKSFQVPATPGTCAWPPNLPSVPTSRATRVTSAAKERSCSTIVLMVFLSSRISPLTSTVIFLDKSPLATAVVTSAMLRTCAVRLPAMKLTESVKILPRAGHARHNGLAAQFAFGADFAGHAGDFGGEGTQLVHHGVDRFLELENFATHVHRDFLGKVAVGHGDGHVGDVAHLGGEVGGH